MWTGYPNQSLKNFCSSGVSRRPVVAIDDHELTTQSGEHAALHGEPLEGGDGRMSGEELLALYVPGRGPRRFIN